MSSLFEGSRDTRIFTSSRPRRSWPKVAAAFAAGVACTILATTFIAGTGRISEFTRISQRAADPAVSTNVPPAASAEPAQASPPATQIADTEKASPPAAQTVAEPAPERHAAVTSPAPAAAASAPETAEKPDEGKSAEAACEQQTWPYVSHECKAAEANGRTMRSVRVITTDRTAPSTVVTAAPPLPAPRTTDGSANPGATSRQTTGSTDGSVSIARDNAGAAQAADAVPLPRAKPEALARTASVPTSSAMRPGAMPDPMMAKPETDGSRSAANPDQATREKRQTREERRWQRQMERQARRNGSARESGRESASDGADPRSVRDRVREVEERPTARRNRSADEDSGYTLVRTQRTRDGRRLSVNQKPVQEERREEPREERPSFPLFPFLFNSGGN